MTWGIKVRGVTFVLAFALALGLFPGVFSWIEGLVTI
jgi:hypothetical protein